MQNYKKIKVVQDTDGHWYVIPNESLSRFHDLLHIVDNESESLSDLFYDSCDMLNEEFGNYRTNGDPNNIQLFIQE